jgi:hypothetical protein
MKANQSGQAVEDTLAGALRAVGLQFARQVTVGRTIYRTELRVDFIVTNLAAFPAGLILESKWQDVSGSIDEKFPYLVENIRQQYPLPVVVIVHGGGCRPGAIEWLRARVDGQRLVAVYNLEEFLSWVMRSEKLARERVYE